MNNQNSKIFKVECVGATRGLPLAAISGTYRVFFPKGLNRILTLHECYSESGDEPLNGNENLRAAWEVSKRIFQFEAQKFGFVPTGFFYEGILVGKDGAVNSAALVITVIS